MAHRSGIGCRQVQRKRPSGRLPPERPAKITNSQLFTDLGGAYSLTLDKRAGVVKFVLACDVLSTHPNWDNLRLLDSEVLGEHLLDRLRMRLPHYRIALRQRSLLTLKRSK